VIVDNDFKENEGSLFRDFNFKLINRK